MQCVKKHWHGTLHVKYSLEASLMVQQLKEFTVQCRGHWLNPLSGQVLQATEQLVLCTITTESMHHRACAPQKKPPQWEGCTPQRAADSALSTRENLCTATKTQGSQKQLNKKNYLFSESISHSVASSSLWSHGVYLARLLCTWDSPDKNTRVGCHFLLQGIFPTLGLNPVLLHCIWTTRKALNKIINK